MDIDAICGAIEAAPFSNRRRMVAVFGPPASGKSTFAEKIAAQQPKSCVVPMDGFHLDNAILDERGLLQRKGAPQTFDAAGFQYLIRRLRREAEVVYPVFDRRSDQAIAGARVVDAQIETVIVEGNYLMLEDAAWHALHELWDLSIELKVPMAVLQKRLTQRWRDHGYSNEHALAKAEMNDLPNAALVVKSSVAGDIQISNE
jgi:pantothenate kinase